MTIKSLICLTLPAVAVVATSCTSVPYAERVWASRKDSIEIPYRDEQTLAPCSPKIMSQFEGLYECDYDRTEEIRHDDYAIGTQYACVEGAWGVNDFRVVEMGNHDYHAGLHVTVMEHMKLTGTRLENADFIIDFSEYDKRNKVYRTMLVTDKGYDNVQTVYKRIPTKR